MRALVIFLTVIWYLMCHSFIYTHYPASTLISKTKLPRPMTRYIVSSSRHINKYANFSLTQNVPAANFESAHALESASNATVGIRSSSYTSFDAIDVGNTEQDLVKFGTIIKPHGIKGGIKIYSDPNLAEIRIRAPGYLYLKQSTGSLSPRRVRITTASRGRKDNEYIVTIPTIISRNMAAQLKHCEVFMPTASRPPLQPNEVYCREIFDMECFWSTNYDEDTSARTIATNVTSPSFARISGIVLPNEICRHKPSTSSKMHALLEIQFTYDDHDANYNGVVTQRIRGLLKQKYGHSTIEKHGFNKVKTWTHKCYIPFVSALIECIDMEQHRIVFRRFPGLTDSSFIERRRGAVRGLLHSIAVGRFADDMDHHT